MSEPVEYEEIAERIDVRPPYYALREVVRAEDRGIEARVSSSQTLGQEIGPITAADAARHMAIAGSVAAGLSNANPGRHMYLAYDAEFRRSRDRPPEEVRDFRLTATETWINPGTAHALIVLGTEDGTPVNTLSVYYMVLPQQDFFAFFADHQRPLPDTREDSYGEVVGLADVEITGDRLKASLGEVEERYCAGHFDGLPAMPVAYLMSNVMDAGTRLLKHVLNADAIKFSAREGSVRAEALAFVGERVDIEVEFQRYSGGTYWLHSRAMVGEDKMVGALHTKLKVRDQTPIG